MWAVQALVLLIIGILAVEILFQAQAKVHTISTSVQQEIIQLHLL